MLAYFLLMIFLPIFNLSLWALFFLYLGGLLYLLLVNRDAKYLQASLGFLLVLFLLNILLGQSYGSSFFTIFGKEISMDMIHQSIRSGLGIVSAFLWFSIMDQAMGQGKIQYLFKGRFPKLSLLVETTLREIKLGKKHYHALKAVRKANALEAKTALEESGLIIGNLVSWSIEAGLGRSQVIEARAYGSGAVTSYLSYDWTWKDRLFLVLLIGLGLVFFGTHFLFNQSRLVENLLVLVLSLLPLLAYLVKEIQWKNYLSKI